MEILRDASIIGDGTGITIQIPASEKSHGCPGGGEWMRDSKNETLLAHITTPADVTLLREHIEFECAYGEVVIDGNRVLSFTSYET